ncbi:hypothetical protein J7K50_07740 [bacterium]|nr:hypothetical protein [bacterium]
MAKAKPLDYYKDYYREPPGIYELAVESRSIAENSYNLRKVSNVARFLMLKHERLVYEALESFVEGKWALAAKEMTDSLAAMPGLSDARVLAALSNYMSGRPKQALDVILPGLDYQGGQTMGRYFKAWLPTLRVLVRLDYDVVVPFYPNRLGMMFLAMSAHRELGNFQEAGLLVERTVNEYYMIDELLYVAAFLHLEMGHYNDAWRLLGSRTYRNTDSLDVGLTMLRAEAMIYMFGPERAIGELRAALQFTRGRNPWLITRARWRIAELYELCGFEIDASEALRKINRDFLPAHLLKTLDSKLESLPKPENMQDGEGEGYKLDPNYDKRFDYVWRGKVDPDEPVDFLEV